MKGTGTMAIIFTPITFSAAQTVRAVNVSTIGDLISHKAIVQHHLKTKIHNNQPHSHYNDAPTQETTRKPHCQRRAYDYHRNGGERRCAAD